MAAHYRISVKHVQELLKLVFDLNNPQIKFTNNKEKDLESAFQVMKENATKLDEFLSGIMLTQAESK